MPRQPDAGGAARARGAAVRIEHSHLGVGRAFQHPRPRFEKGVRPRGAAACGCLHWRGVRSCCRERQTTSQKADREKRERAAAERAGSPYRRNMRTLDRRRRCCCVGALASAARRVGGGRAGAATAAPRPAGCPAPACCTSAPARAAPRPGGVRLKGAPRQPPGGEWVRLPRSRGGAAPVATRPRKSSVDAPKKTQTAAPKSRMKLRAPPVGSLRGRSSAATRRSATPPGCPVPCGCSCGWSGQTRCRGPFVWGGWGGGVAQFD